MCLKIFKTKKWNSIKELLNAAVQVLEKANIDDAKQNVNQMASKALNISYTQLPLHWQKPVSDNFLKDLDSMITDFTIFNPDERKVIINSNLS